MSTTTSKKNLIQKFAEKFSFTDDKKLIDTLKATAFKIKDGVVTDEQMLALLVVADQYGLNPFTKEIFAYPDKQNGIVPVVSVDGWFSIINRHEQFDGVEFVYSEEMAERQGAKPCFSSIECVMYRKDRSHPVRIREFLDEVYREPFKGNGNNGAYTVNSPWQTHTKRMLRHKALIQCARAAFGFAGIYDQDEAERIIEGQIVSAEKGEISAYAVQMAGKLIDRATKENSWQAALDYVAEKFSGADLNFILAEVNRAKVEVEARLLGSAEPLATEISTDPSVATSGKDKAVKAAMAQAA